MPTCFLGIRGAARWQKELNQIGFNVFGLGLMIGGRNHQSKEKPTARSQKAPSLFLPTLSCRHASLFILFFPILLYSLRLSPPTLSSPFFPSASLPCLPCVFCRPLSLPLLPILPVPPSLSMPNLPLWYVCMHIYTYIYIYVYVGLSVCLSVCPSVCLSVCMSVRMYICGVCVYLTCPGGGLRGGGLSSILS